MVLLEHNSGRTAPWNMLWNSCVSPKVSFFFFFFFLRGKLGGGKCLLRCTLKRGVFKWPTDVLCVVKLMRS